MSSPKTVDDAKARINAMCATKAAQLDLLLSLCGHWQDGSCETVRLGWDDATRTFHIIVGKRTYYGSDFAAALGGVRDKFNDPVFASRDTANPPDKDQSP